jgi:hypothetical protein
MQDNHGRRVEMQTVLAVFFFESKQAILQSSQPNAMTTKAFTTSKRNCAMTAESDEL